MASLSLPLVQRALIAPVRSLDRTRVLLIAALGAVYVVWGSTYLAIEVVLPVVPPLLLLAARFALAGALLLAWAYRRGRPYGAPRLTLAAWGRAALDGTLLLGIGTGLTVLAQTRLSSGTTALLAATVPVWLALLGRGMLGEPLSRRAWLGLGVGLVGVAVLVDPRGGGEVGAMLLVLLAAGAWALGSVRGRRHPVPARPQVAAAMEMLTASVLFLAVGLLVGEHNRVAWSGVTTVHWLAFAYLTLGGSIVAFLAYRWLLNTTTTTVVGTFAYVNPVVAVALGWLVLGERLGGRTLAAGGLVLVAVVLLITGRPGAPIPAQLTSGGDVFAGTGRWQRVRRRLGRLPAGARLFVDPHAPQLRSVGYAEPLTVPLAGPAQPLPADPGHGSDHHHAGFDLAAPDHRHLGDAQFGDAQFGDGQFGDGPRGDEP